MVKKLLSVMALCVVLAMGNVAYADEPITVFVDGKQLVGDQNPFVRDGRTLVPIRHFADAIGGSAKWDDENSIAWVYYKDKIIGLRPDEKIAWIYNSQAVLQGKSELDVPATIVNGRTMVPLRFLSETFGARVDVAGTAQGNVVYITMQNAPAASNSNAGSYVPQVTHSDQRINEALMAPWIEKNGVLYMTLGDAFLKNFQSSDWDIYNDKYGRELIGFKGKAETAWGGSIPVTFYWDTAFNMVQFEMQGLIEETLMGEMMIRAKLEEDWIEFVQQHPELYPD